MKDSTLLDFYVDHISYGSIIGRRAWSSPQTAIAILAIVSMMILAFVDANAGFLIAISLFVTISFYLWIENKKKTAFRAVTGMESSGWRLKPSEVSRYQEVKLWEYIEARQLDIDVAIDMLKRLMDQKVPSVVSAMKPAVLVALLAPIWVPVINSIVSQQGARVAWILSLGALVCWIVIVNGTLIVEELEQSENRHHANLYRLLINIRLRQ